MVKAAEETAVKKAVRKKECINALMANSTTKQTTESKVKRQAVMIPPKRLPRVDIFLNPNKTQEVAAIAAKKEMIARNYFQKSDMKTLFPELFQILWQSTLPCFQGNVFH